MTGAGTVATLVVAWMLHHPQSGQRRTSHRCMIDTDLAVIRPLTLAAEPSPAGEGPTGPDQPARNGVSSWPSPSTSTITRSPPLSHTGSFMPEMTPAGVPVIITSPGSSVKYVLQ
jgi:hypothetical protein